MPFRMIAADAGDLKPSIDPMRRLMRRWSCSIRLLRYFLLRVRIGFSRRRERSCKRFELSQERQPPGWAGAASTRSASHQAKSSESGRIPATRAAIAVAANGRPLRSRQFFDLRAKVGERRAVAMEPELVDDPFESVGAASGRLHGQLPPGAKNRAGGAGIGAGRAQVPGVAQGVLGAAGEPHAAGGASYRGELGSGLSDKSVKPGSAVKSKAGRRERTRPQSACCAL